MAAFPKIKIDEVSNILSQMEPDKAAKIRSRMKDANSLEFNILNDRILGIIQKNMQHINDKRYLCPISYVEIKADDRWTVLKIDHEKYCLVLRDNVDTLIERKPKKTIYKS